MEKKDNEKECGKHHKHEITYNKDTKDKEFKLRIKPWAGRPLLSSLNLVNEIISSLEKLILKNRGNRVILIDWFEPTGHWGVRHSVGRPFGNGTHTHTHKHWFKWK